jgi:mevalonate kinase
MLISGISFHARDLLKTRNVKHYHANGKVLLTGEYMVMYGASALVLPLRLGQSMQVESTHYDRDALISWRAEVLGEPWFSAMIRITDWTLKATTDEVVATKLIKLLQEAEKMNHLLFSPGSGYDIITNTSFNMNWGFGSSSALLANIAQWGMINPFELNFRISEGSGADVAGAISPGPVIYQKIKKHAVYSRLHFKPSFYKHLWLVYLGGKQDTTESVHAFMQTHSVKQHHIDRIDQLTREIARTDTLEVFLQLIREHEIILSEVLGLPRIREAMFDDFNGEVKSLGAWGGDFVLAASEDSDTEIRAYFEKNGLHPVFSFDEIML